MKPTDWNFDFSSLQRWNNRETIHDIYDRFYEIPQNDALCCLYSITEARMGDYRGFLAILKNKEDPSVLVDIGSGMNFCDNFAVSDDGNLIFLMPHIYDPRYWIISPILLIDLKTNRFSYILTDNINPCYKIVQKSEGLFEVETFESQRNDERLMAIHGMKIRPDQLNWYTLSKLPSLPNMVKQGPRIGDRFRRLAAFFIDWNLSMLTFGFAAVLCTSLGRQFGAPDGLLGFLSVALIVCAFASFVLRDVIFKGRSLGKRLFGLKIYDKYTLQEPSVGQRVKRNAFFFLYTIDGIVLLATGESIGDRLANTIVASSKPLRHDPPAKPAVSSADPKNHAKTALLITGIVLACLLGFIGLIQIVLNAQKNTPEYQVAYQYLVTSESFGRTGAEEADIRLNRYSASTRYTTDGTMTKTVQIGFIVRYRTYTVVCHQEDGQWIVCEECTLFD